MELSYNEELQNLLSRDKKHLRLLERDYCLEFGRGCCKGTDIKELLRSSFLDNATRRRERVEIQLNSHSNMSYYLPFITFHIKEVNGEDYIKTLKTESCRVSITWWECWGKKKQSYKEKSSRIMESKLIRLLQDCLDGED